MVYWLTFQTAVRLRSFAGMVPKMYSLVPSSDQYLNVYPSLVGAAGADMAKVYFLCIEETSEPPSESKVMVYTLGVHEALRVMFSAGIVVKVYFHTLCIQYWNSYPSLVSVTSGAETSVP